MSHNLHLRRLGTRPYEPVWRAMRTFTDGRDTDTPDELWLLQHPPVYTLGQAGKREHVLAPGDIPVIPADRGGQVTYHGPGQLVGYTLFDLHRLGMGIRSLVATLERALINLLADYGIEAGLRPGAPGVYVDGAKIAALGMRVRRGRTFHGISLNVDMDLEPFTRINPCGYPGLAVVDMASLGATPAMTEVENALTDHIGRLLHYTVLPEISSHLPHE